jgi:hypothetical protein
VHVDYAREIATNSGLQNFVMTFQAKKPQPLVYIRSLLQSFLFKDMVVLGNFSIRDIIDDDLAIVSMPCNRLLDRANDAVEAPQDPRFALSHQMELFRQRVAACYLDIFRAFCQNRCRVRRTLCHSIQDWETVQIDAESIDVLLQVQVEEQPILPEIEGSLPAYSLPLSSWCYLYKLRLMEWIVQLGFELEVYQPGELAGMYWYLSYLSRTRGQHVERIKTFVMHALNEHRAPNKTFTLSMETQYTRSLSYLRTMILDSMVVSDLADSLGRLYTVLLRLGLVPPTPCPYSNDELHYEIRMKPFATIGLPDLPPYRDFTMASTRPDTSTEDLLVYAERSLMAARKGLDLLSKMTEKEAFTAYTHERWLESTKNSLKSAIATALAISMVKKHDPSKLKVEIPKAEKGYHEWWTVPKISEKH